jgi:hypothetical protein
MRMLPEFQVENQTDYGSWRIVGSAETLGNAICKAQVWVGMTQRPCRVKEVQTLRIHEVRLPPPDTAWVAWPEDCS